MASDGVYEGVVSGNDAAAAPPPAAAALPFSPAYAFPSQPPPPNPTYSAVMSTEDMSVEEVDCGDTATAAAQQQPQLLLPCSATMNEEEEENEEAESAPRRLQVDPAVLRELHDSRTRYTNSSTSSSSASPYNYCYYNNAYGVDPATAALARHCHRGLFADNNNNNSIMNCRSDGAWPSQAGSLRPPSPRTLQRLLAQAAATGQPIDWAKAASLAASGVPMSGAPAVRESIPLALTWYPDIPAGATAHPERKRPVRSENSSNEEAGGSISSSCAVLDRLLPSSSQAEQGSEADVQGGSGGGSAPVWSFPRVKRARQEEPQKELLSEEHYYYKGHYYSRERDKASAAALVPTPCEGTEVRAADQSVPVAVQKRRAGAAKRARDGMTMYAADDDDEDDVAQRHRRTEETM